ncbi:hypothetical protein OPV22_011884 [Ensete ventricosum]|uniref:TCTP domain-containing protein n=1 Tax=Ensete ventricosum TaxID=4639 RepID=A0AAV8RP50_ENSVE|nr:hypothetical protein OPV22_011884 [Ensete ventricosum]
MVDKGAFDAKASYVGKDSVKLKSQSMALCEVSVTALSVVSSRNLLSLISPDDDELLSDSFHCKEIENGMLWEVEGKWVVKGSTDADIGANSSAEVGVDEGVDDSAVKVVDIVDTFRLFRQAGLLTPKLDEEMQELFKKHIEGATKLLLPKPQRSTVIHY